MRNAIGRVTATVILAACLQSGCLRGEQKATLFPDGSGKITLKVSVKKSMIQMMRQMQRMGEEDGGDQDSEAKIFSDIADVEKLLENSEGIVAWTTAKSEEQGDWVGVTATGYFEDINKVKLYEMATLPTGDTERKLAFSCKYQKSAAGGVLHLDNETLEKVRRDAPGLGGAEDDDAPENEFGQAMLEMMRPMLQDLRIGFVVTVPGKIKESAGFLEANDRVASVVIDGNNLLEAGKNPKGDAAKKLKSVFEAGDMRVAWSESQVSSAEAEAFRKEMDEAKQSWARRVEEHKRRRQGDKPGKPKDY